MHDNELEEESLYKEALFLSRRLDIKNIQGPPKAAEGRNRWRLLQLTGNRPKGLPRVE